MNIWIIAILFFLSLADIASLPSGDVLQRNKHQTVHAHLDINDRNSSSRPFHQSSRSPVSRHVGFDGDTEVRNRMTAPPLRSHPTSKENRDYLNNDANEGYNIIMGYEIHGIEMSKKSNSSEIFRGSKSTISDSDLWVSRTVTNLNILRDVDRTDGKEVSRCIDNNMNFETVVLWSILHNSYDSKNYVLEWVLCRGNFLSCRIIAANTSKNYKLGDVSDSVIESSEISNERNLVGHDVNGKLHWGKISRNFNPQAKEETRHEKRDISSQHPFKRIRTFRFPLQPNKFSNQQVTGLSLLQLSSHLDLKSPEDDSQVRDYIKFSADDDNQSDQQSDLNVESIIVTSEPAGQETVSRFENKTRIADTIVTAGMTYGKNNSSLDILISLTFEKLDEHSSERSTLSLNTAPTYFSKTHQNSESSSPQTLPTNVSRPSSTGPVFSQPFVVTSTSFILTPSESSVSLVQTPFISVSHPSPLISLSPPTITTTLVSLVPSVSASSSTPQSSHSPPSGNHLHKQGASSLHTASHPTPLSGPPVFSRFSRLVPIANPDHDDAHKHECNSGDYIGNGESDSDLGDNDYTLRENGNFVISEIIDKAHNRNGDDDDLNKSEVGGLMQFFVPPLADDRLWQLPPRPAVAASSIDSSEQVTVGAHPTPMLTQAITLSSLKTSRQGQHPPTPGALYETPKVQAPAKPLQFSYEVYSRENHYGHQEERIGSRVTGTYHVILPNGLRQVVSYYADETGYHPTITYKRVNDIDPRSVPL